MSSSSEAKNLERIVQAIDHHNATCEYPAVAIEMNPFEVERLGWDTIKGLPVRANPDIGTGAFRVVCGRDELETEETVEEVVTQQVPIVVE